MSIQLGHLVTQILNDYFGDIVQTVGSDLYRYGAKPINSIVKSTNLSRSQVIESLCALIKYGLVTFEPSSNETIADYKLCHDNVLLLLRYPRYLLETKNKYGSEAEMIVEELLQEGIMTATNLLINIMKKYKDEKDKKISLPVLRDTLTSLVTAGYVHHSPVPVLDGEELNLNVPTLKQPQQKTLPDIDISSLNEVINSGVGCLKDDEIYWKVNYDRFHQDFRDDLMIKAMQRRIDDSAGELMRHLLVQMYLRTDPWVPISNPIPAVEIRDSCRRSADFPLLSQYLDQYLKVMEDNSLGMVIRAGDAGGGQFCVDVRAAIRQLTMALIDYTVQEKHGSKAARIFRLIRSKKYMEEEDIQKYAMLPAKESKQLTYRLMEEHFIHVQPMRRPATGGGGPTKAIYLYYVDLHKVATAMLEWTYVALGAAGTRAAFERSANRRLLDKQARVASIVHAMRRRQDPDNHIKDMEDTVTPPEQVVLCGVHGRLQTLSAAQLQLDRSLFLLQLYFLYPK